MLRMDEFIDTTKSNDRHTMGLKNCINVSGVIEQWELGQTSDW